MTNFIIAPQDDPSRPAVYTSGDLYTLLATSPETNFTYNAFDFFAPVGGGPRPHFHGYDHETFYIVEGEFNFSFGDEVGIPNSPKQVRVESLPEGTFIFGPRLRPHGWSNTNSTAANSGTTPGARILSVSTPGGLDFFFQYAGQPVFDRNQPIPPPLPGVDPKQLEFALLTSSGLPFPGYIPPTNVDYLLVLPEDASAELTSRIQNTVAGVDNLQLWSFNQRPKYIGPFGIEYTSLANFQETSGEFSYTQFSLAPQPPNIFPTPITNERYQALYVKDGVLTINIDGQTQIAEANTFIGIAPGQSYSIANFGNQTVKALSVDIPPFSQTIIGSPSDDYLTFNGGDYVYGAEGNDVIVSQRVLGGNVVNGNQGNDIIIGYQNDILMGGKGDDIIMTDSGKGGNYLLGQLGNDILIAGSGDRLNGGEGSDLFIVANGQLPTASNIVEDFQIGVDKIGIRGIIGVTSINNLKLMATPDLGSTAIYTAEQDFFRFENGQLIILDVQPLAIIQNVLFTSLTANDFLFS
jgi:Ca2+-binding RTX toxin-like protein